MLNEIIRCFVKDFIIMLCGLLYESSLLTSKSNILSNFSVAAPYSLGKYMAVNIRCNAYA